MALLPPVIISPGNPKSLSDNKASIGSTVSKFKTSNGNFIVDGVIKGDYLVSLDGNNRSLSRKVIQVGSDYLISESFPYSWEVNESIKIYRASDRPKYVTNSLGLQISGTVESTATSVIYTTSQNGLDPVRVYALKQELYDIDSTNDNLILNVNGIDKNIILSHGVNRNALSIIDEINSYFTFTVAFREQASLIKPAVFFIEGVTVKVITSTAAAYFDICIGDFIFAKSLTATGVIGTGNRCSIQITLDTNRTIDLSIDGNIVPVTVPDNSEFNPRDIAESLNSQAGKCIASAGQNKLILLAENNLTVNADVDFLGLDKSITGFATLNSSVGSSDSEWVINLDVPSNSFNINLFSVDGDRSDPSELEVAYLIDQPSLVPSIQDVIDTNTVDCVAKLPTEEDILSLSGNYDTQGQGVIIDGQEVFSSNGIWTSNLNLEEGDNDLIIQTLDIFGNTSDKLNLKIQYSNPNTKTAVASPNVSALRWKSMTTPSFSPADVENAKEFIGTVFKPVTSLLEGISQLLKIARAFIVDNVLSALNAVRSSIQKFINDIIGTLRDLSRGLGVYAISTIPRLSDLKTVGSWNDALRVFQRGGTGKAFDAFVDQLVRSFDDVYDAKRPQLSNNVTTGGYALAIADSGGIINFMQTIGQINRIVEKEIMDFGIPAPTNIRVSNENKRVVITWKAGEAIRPGKYVIQRAKRAGGVPEFKKVKTNLPKPGQSNYTEEILTNEDTGDISTKYEEIGTINFHPGTITSGKSETRFTTVNITSDDPSMDSERQVDRIDFRFIDGKATAQENKEKNATQAVLDGTVNFLKASKDFLLVQQGVSTKNEDLINGETYYYKIFPQFGEEKGQSYEVSGSPQAPELIFIDKEELISQINDDEGKGLRYILSGSIFDKDSAVYASDPSEKHLEVLVDGGRIIPTKIQYDKGVIDIRVQDMPKQSIQVSYWTKKNINTTRAILVGTEQGDFRFTKTNVEGHILEILVGPTGSPASGFGTGSSGAITVPITQKITLVRDFRGADHIDLKAEEVASIIRNQTGGLKVSVDRKGRIVLIDNQNANPLLGSKLEIIKGNKVLGFTTGQIDSAGSMGLPPDWFRLSVADLFPIINDVIRYIENNSRALLRSLEDATNALTDFIDTLIKRVETLQDIIRRLQELAEKMAEILTFKAGVWSLNIPARPGGTEYLKKALNTSVGRPSADFAGGVLFVYADGSTQKALEFIFKSLG